MRSSNRPGMGAAFAAHFLLNATDAGILATWKVHHAEWPCDRYLRLVILAPMSAAEAAYFLTRSDGGGDSGEIGNYTAIIQYEYLVLVDEEDL